jgi:hypothetical protein
MGYYMERGFGWHYPPGTPGPRTVHGSVTCEDCEYQGGAKLIHDLGTADLVPEVCPSCGSERLKWEEGGCDWDGW